MITTKKQQVTDYLKKNDLKNALRIAKTFTIELNKDQQRSVQIAYESLTGKASYYQQLGIDTTSQLQIAESVLRSIYLS